MWFADGVFKMAELTPILVRANACVNATLVILMASSVLRALLFVIQVNYLPLSQFNWTRNLKAR